MTTYQRDPRWADTGARWLYVTDGGHYENLGVLSLLRRGVQCVVAVDATQDAGRTYDDLKTLRKRVGTDLKMTWLTPLPGDGSDTKGRYRFEIGDREGNLQAVVLYLKSNANDVLPHMDPDSGRRLYEDRIRYVKWVALRDLEGYPAGVIDDSHNSGI